MFDLFDECGEDLSSCGFETVPLEKFDVTLNKLFIDTPAKARKLGFDKGHYFIINAPLFAGLMDEHKEILQNAFCERMKFLFKEHKIEKSSKILLVGIGNPHLTADSFGIWTAAKVTILPFKKNNRIFKLFPNVFTNTGLNAYEIIRLLVEAYDITAVVLFDSLATTNLSRLGCSLQFNDAGLTPGSAMNNFGMAINSRSLCVPCFSIGLPTMISSKNLGQKRDVVLTDKDIEKQIDFLSTLVAEGLDKILKNMK